MLRKISCVSCAGCCEVTNDEPTNGVKILRKKDSPVIDLNSDLLCVSNSTVISRLKLILEKIENGFLDQISTETLQKNIQYALQLIQEGETGIKDRETEDIPIAIENDTEKVETETTQIETENDNDIVNDSDTQITNKENCRQEESENELSEVDEEVIPEEVRQWLAATFTKNLPPKQRLEPRPKFRSVANAIRVGLFVDRFYRQLSSTTLQIPAELQHLLKEINNWHFDIFKLHDRSTSHSLKYVAKELFSRYGLVQRFRINLDKLDAFLGAVEYGYTKLKNPYHNDVHAADVTQTLHYFIGSSGAANILSDLEIFALLFAALIHDFEHTGRTNNFHVNVGTDLALLYNDRSVLENHHVSAAFRLLKDDDKNILSFLKPEEFREFRNLVIEMVLSTDMSSHFAQIKHVRALLNGDKSSHTTTTLMSLMLHCADISHPGKPWRIHKQLADLILAEFFLQGDEESKLGLPFSPLCDRNNVLVPESQISFIEFIVEPSLSILSDMIDFVTSKVDEGPLPLTSVTTTTTSSTTTSTSNSNTTTITTSSSSSTNPALRSPNSNRTQNISQAKHSAVTRRAESDKCISSSGQGNSNTKLVLNSRTPSFPLQAGHNTYGPNTRPWINHLVENKAKWRMISAEHASLNQKPVN